MLKHLFKLTTLALFYITCTDSPEIISDNEEEEIVKPYTTNDNKITLKESLKPTTLKPTIQNNDKKYDTEKIKIDELGLSYIEHNPNEAFYSSFKDGYSLLLKCNNPECSKYRKNQIINHSIKGAFGKTPSIFHPFQEQYLLACSNCNGTNLDIDFIFKNVVLQFFAVVLRGVEPVDKIRKTMTKIVNCIEIKGSHYPTTSKSVWFTAFKVVCSKKTNYFDIVTEAIKKFVEKDHRIVLGQILNDIKTNHKGVKFIDRQLMLFVYEALKNPKKVEINKSYINKKMEILELLEKYFNYKKLLSRVLNKNMSCESLFNDFERSKLKTKDVECIYNKWHRTYKKNTIISLIKHLTLRYANSNRENL